MAKAGNNLRRSNTGSPRPSATPSSTGSFRAVSWNIRHGLGNDGVVDLDRIADVIRESGAAIVGLQEVDRGGARSGRVDQTAMLARILGMESRFAANAIFDQGGPDRAPHEYGIAILSIYPIVDEHHLLLANSDGWEQRGALAVTISLPNGRQLSVINTHLQWAGEEHETECSQQRAQQVEEVLTLATSFKTPTIVMGDFNAVPDSPELASIERDQSGLYDAWRATNGGADGFTIPAHPDRNATSRIDFLFVSGAITVRTTEMLVTVRTRMASDHYPVATNLAYRHD